MWYFGQINHTESTSSALSLPFGAIDDSVGAALTTDATRRSPSPRRLTGGVLGALLLVATLGTTMVAWVGSPAAAGAGPIVTPIERSGAPAQEPVPAPEPVDVPAPRTYSEQLARGTSSSRSGTTGVVPHQPYNYWSWPESGYEEISDTLTVQEADPQGHYYWAHSFILRGGDQGYSGLQVGSAPQNTKIAMFAIWGATAAEGASCRTYDNEGSGWTCRVDPYQWLAGRPYELRTVRDEITPQGTWIKGTIIDTVTGVVTVIGRIRVPPTWGDMVGFSSWTEWFGPALPTCAAFPRSRVTWDAPRAIAAGGRVDRPGLSEALVQSTHPAKACPSHTFITTGARRAVVQTVTATPWAPFVSWSTLVDRQYRDVVGRAPTAAERDGWTPDLTSGARRPGEVVATLRRSRDNVTFVDPVARLYYAYFRRSPDAAGLAYWVGERRQGRRSLVAVSSSYASSAEFKRTYGALTDSAFVDLVYRNVLGRSGDAAGRAYWTNELTSGRKSRGGVMVAFSESAEHRTIRAMTVDASVLHILVLGRAPTAAEFYVTVDEVGQGMSWATLAHTLLVSAEYGRRISG